EHELEAGQFPFHVLLEPDLGTGQETDGDVRFRNRGKSAGGGIPKLRRDQPVADIGRARCDAMETVIAHGWRLSVLHCPTPQQPETRAAVPEWRDQVLLCSRA